MIDENLQPLAIAGRVLLPQTVNTVRGLTDYTLRGWRILDRWAFNNPDGLKKLESQGEVVLLGRLLEQQRIEQAAVNCHRPDVAEMDVLVAENVQTELET